MVRQTSLQAYKRINTHLGQRQKQVLMAFYMDGPATDREVAESMNRPINTVTPRRNELVNKELLEEKGKRPCGVTGKRALVWRVKPSKERLVNEILGVKKHD